MQCSVRADAGREWQFLVFQVTFPFITTTTEPRTSALLFSRKATETLSLENVIVWNKGVLDNSRQRLQHPATKTNPFALQRQPAHFLTRMAVMVHGVCPSATSLSVEREEDGEILKTDNEPPKFCDDRVFESSRI